MIEHFLDPQTWAALLTIIGVNIVLSGDNAVVIALACRSLPPSRQKWGVAAGAGIAVVLRIIFTIFIAFLLTVPYLKFAGGLLLFWVGHKLALGDDDGGEIDAAQSIWHAVRIVVIADAVMSLDNVIAVAAAAKGDFTLLVAGLIISIPMVVYGATYLIKLINRFPVIVPAGAALIGFIGGEVMVTDTAVEPWVDHHALWLHALGPLLGAVLVIVVSRLMMTHPQPVEAKIVAEEAVAGGALLAVRAVLVRLVPFILGTVAYGLSDGPDIDGQGAIMQTLHALRPIFAAVIAIMVGEAIAGLVQRFRRPTTAL